MMKVTSRRGYLDPRHERPPVTATEHARIARVVAICRAEGCDCHVVHSWRDVEPGATLSVYEEHDPRCAWERARMMAALTGPMRAWPE